MTKQTTTTTDIAKAEEVFAIQKSDDFFFEPGFARELRANCKNGEFWIRDTTNIGSSMSVIILAQQELHNVMILKDKSPRDWVELLVLKDNAVSSLLVHGISMENLKAYGLELKIGRVHPTTIETDLAFKSHAHPEHGIYYSVTFKKGKEVAPEQLEKLAGFVKKNLPHFKRSFRFQNV